MGNKQSNQNVSDNQSEDINDDTDKIIIHDKLMKFYDESLDNFEILRKNLKELTELQLSNDINHITRINEIRQTIDSIMKANNLLNENIKNINSTVIESTGGKRSKRIKQRKKRKSKRN